MILLSEPLPQISSEVAALLGAGGGAIILKILELVFAKSNKVVDLALKEATDMRQSLREDVEILKKEVQQLRIEADTWRDKYYASQDEINTLKFQVKVLTDRVEELTAKLGEADEK